MQQDIQVVKAKAVVAAEFLARQGFDVKNTVILEMLARIEGFRNWSAYREQLAITPAISNPPTEHEALTMCYRWLCSAPIDELEAVEQALGENAPMGMARDALNAAVETVAEKPAVKEKAVVPPWTSGMEPMSDAQYVARGGHCCPSCGSRNISASSVDSDAVLAWHKVTCDDCDANWVDELRRSGYSELEGGIDLEAIESVVDDVRSRADEYGFAVSSENVRECVDESCDILGEDLSEPEIRLAVTKLTI
jgi:hypothetical protein